MMKTKYENLRRILNFTTYKTFKIKTSLRISKTQEALKVSSEKLLHQNTKEP